MSASSAALQSAMFANEDGPPPPFIPTSQWAPILPGQSVPPGLWMRMDISTGVRLARLMPKDGERAAEVEGGEGAPGSASAGGDPRSPVGVRDDEFDESAPAEDEGATPETFFQTFAPVFERNEKFSKRGPIPKLGDISSSDAEVTAFYDFWHSFISCREFRLEDNSRRADEKQQKKQQQAARHNDTERVRRLAAAAFAKDPRVQRIKRAADEQINASIARQQAQMAANEALEQERIAAAAAAKINAQRERDAAAAALAQSAAAALAAEQEERRMAREGAKRVRATFGKLCKASGLPEQDVDALRASLTIEQMQPIIEGFTAEEQSAQAKELFSTHLAALRAVEQAAARARDEAAAAAAAAKKQREAAAVWTEEEEAMLAKAIKLHAPGSGLRWHKISELIATVSRIPRELTDVVARARALDNALLLQHQRNAQPQQNSGSGDSDEGRQQQQRNGSSQAQNEQSSSRPVVAVPTEAAAAAAAEASRSPVSPAAAVSASAGPASPPAALTFSASEQQRLELGLQTVPRTAPDRWDQIAAIVGTRTKAQCIARFKQVVAHLQAQRQQQQQQSQ